MEPTRKEIADLFSVILPTEAVVNAPERKAKGDDANESCELGAQSLNAGDYEKAIQHFRRAIEQRKEKDAKDNLDLGGAYEFADRAPEALRQYEPGRTSL
jgi:Flp pilus assembly protein TadD